VRSVQFASVTDAINGKPLKILWWRLKLLRIKQLHSLIVVMVKIKKILNSGEYFKVTGMKHALKLKLVLCCAKRHL